MFSQQLSMYRSKHVVSKRQEDLHDFVLVLQNFDNVLLANFKDKENFYQHVFISPHFVEVIEKLEKKLKKIKLAAKKLQTSFTNVSDQLQDLEVCRLILRELLDKKSLGLKLCYEQFVIPLVNKFWNFKYQFETQYDILLGKRPTKFREYSSDLTINNLDFDSRNEIFSYLSQKEKFEKRTVSKKFKSDLYASFVRDRFQTMNVIETINNIKTLSDLYEFLDKYRSSPAYRKLLKTKFENMTSYEAICFTLTRAAKDTCLINPRLLSTYLEKIKNQLPLNISNSIRVTILAFQYSMETNPTIKKDIAKKIKDNLLQRKSPYTLINFSGMDLQNLVLNETCLSLVDFTGADLQEVNLIDCDLKGVSLIDANLTSIYFRFDNTPSNENELVHFFSSKCFTNPNLLSKTLDQLWGYIKNHRFMPARLWFLGKAITSNLCISISAGDISIADKINLLKIAIHHTMYNDYLMNLPDSGIEAVKEMLNFSIGLFNSRYRPQYARYFHTRNIYFHEERKQLIELKKQLELDLMYQEEQEKDLLYYQALRCLSR